MRSREHTEIIGVLETVKLEWFRRLTALHNDKCSAEHGDVFVPPVTEQL